MDDALKPDDREKSGAESREAGQKKNAERQKRLPPRRLGESARQASFARTATTGGGAGSAAPVHGAARTAGRFVLAVAGCVVLRHFCVHCRSVELARPSCHAPVSPSAPYCRKIPAGGLCAGFRSRRAPGCVFKRILIQNRGRSIHICLLTGHTGELQRSISLTIERRWKGAGGRRWAERRGVLLACHRSTGTKKMGFKSSNQSTHAIFRQAGNSANRNVVFQGA